MLSERSCGPLCQHPTCWASINQQLKGIRRRQVELKDNLTDSSDDEDELPTQKVYNMLDDYGPNDKDRYPSKHQGRPKEKQVSAEPVPYGMSLRTGTTAPFATPATLSGGPRKFNTHQITPKTVKKIPQFNKVEVQELFDLDDLQKDWHETFLPSKYYVWVPGPKRTPRLPETERLTISKMSQGPVPLPTKDLTESMVPRELESQRQQSRRHQQRPASPRRPKSQRRFINLLDLPRDVLLAVLESLEQSNELTRDEVQNALLQVVPAFSRHETALSMTSSALLQQQKVRLVESQNRNVRQPELYQTKPTFHLDDHPPTPVDDRYEVESVLSSNREIRSLSDYPPGHGKRQQLPALRSQSPKSKTKMTSISLGLPEIPTGYKFTKPFTYYKGNDIDFSLGPVTSVAPSERDTVTRESDIESTLHVTIPSVPSERDDLEYVFRRRPSGEVLHHVSPADSTNVPKTPVATPASHGKASNGQEISAKLNDVIQLPVHAPPTSPVSMEAAHLGPAREVSFDVVPNTEKAEIQNSHSQLKSRGGRSVHFAPGITTPSGTPAPDTQPNTPVANRTTNQTPLTGTGTSAASVAVTGTQISCMIEPSPGMAGPSLVIRDRDSSIASSPEPWPVVNEEEFMTVPETPPGPKEEDEHPQNETPDSKLADLDEQSVKALMTPTSRSEPSPGLRADLAFRLMPDSDFSPAPPPPSPEMRQCSQSEPSESSLPEKLERSLTKELSMMPVLEEEQDGTVTDRTDRTGGEPESVERATFQPESSDTLPEEVSQYANMANDAISNLMSKIGDNFQTSEQMLADIARRNSSGLTADAVEERQEVKDDGFKQDLREELEKIDDKLDEQTQGDDHNDENQERGSGFKSWNWIQ